MDKEICDNCGEEITGKRMRCNFCNEVFCADDGCAGHHRSWCTANDEWDFE